MEKSQIDNLILDNLLYLKNGRLSINVCRVKKSWIDKHLGPDIFVYILSRFEDLQSADDIPEILYRLRYGLNKQPICEVCGQHICKFINFKNGYSRACSKSCREKLIEHHEFLSDSDILNHFIKNDRLVSSYISELYCRQHGYYDYLYSRFTDIDKADSIQEIIYRIKNNITEKPKCPICGKSVSFKRFKDGYRQYCSIECSRKSNEFHQHCRNTRAVSKVKKWKSLGYDIEFDPNDIHTYTVYNKCKKHNPFKIKDTTFFNRWNKPEIVMCPICNPERNPESSIETVIKNILDNHQIKYREHDRIVINPKELDFYIDEFKLGIECNGIYWHNGVKHKSNVMVKYKLAENIGIDILSFWEDDIRYKSDIIESMILDKCHKLPVIDYQQCNIHEITDRKIINEFIRHNSLQHIGNYCICYGLFDLSNTLIGLITLDVGGNICNYCILNGFSKSGLIDQFCRYIQSSMIFYKQIYININREFADTQMFINTGFIFSEIIDQNFSLYNYRVSKFRFNPGEYADDGKCLKCYNAGYLRFMFKLHD